MGWEGEGKEASENFYGSLGLGVRSIYIRVHKAMIPTPVHPHLPCGSHASPISSTPHHHTSTHLRRPRNPRIPLRIPPHIPILLLLFPLRIRLRSLTRLEALLEISNDIIDMFGADGNTDEVFCDAGVDALGFGKLFVRCGPGMDG